MTVTNEDLLNALREHWKKIDALEKKIDKLLAERPQQDRLSLPGSTKTKNPQHALLRGKLLAAWAKTKGSKYSFEGRDAKALASLLRRGLELPAIEAQWVRAMKAGCASIFAFDMNFNAYNAVEGSTTRPSAAGTDLYAGQVRP